MTKCTQIGGENVSSVKSREGAEEARDQDHENRGTISRVRLGQIVAAPLAGGGYGQEAYKQTPLATVRAAAAKARQQRIGAVHIGGP